MKRWPLAPLVGVLFAGCAVTGNPREGGLFGWSESLARERVAERRANIAAADAELAREQRSGAAAGDRLWVVTREEAAAAHQRDRIRAALDRREAAISAKAAQLEADSPTPASASRAHRLRLAVDATRRDPQLSPDTRARELRRLELEIDAARAGLAQ